MELKEKLVSSFMAFEERIDVQSDLHDVRTSPLKISKTKASLPKKKKLGNTLR
jgi:Fe-S cluster assembly protein SufD